MNRFLVVIIFTLCHIIYYTYSELSIRKVSMRSPKPTDIGLIFDISVLNDASKKKQLFDFRIRCEKCCLNLPDNTTTCDVAKLVGGNFGDIDPGAVKVVSILWPTVTLFNRVGFCNIYLASTNKTGSKARVAHIIKFDTTINKEFISDTVQALVSGNNISICTTVDLNPLKSCVPVDCEEKYFGQRNFFNTRRNICEPVPDCTSSTGDVIYDYTINECVNLNRMICQEEIVRLRDGAYDNNTWEPKHSVEVYSNFTHLPKELYDNVAIKSNTDDAYVRSAWYGILQGFFMILAALAIYLCISCCMYTLMVIITKRATIKRSISNSIRH